MSRFLKESEDDETLAWKLTDILVREAQEEFLPVWEKTKGDDGYVSFELDPLLEDPDQHAVDRRTKRSATSSWARSGARGHKNRMIKVPATPGGLAALEELAAAGVTLNVTLIFSERQYHAARDAIWRGAQRRKSLDGFKSVYSIFVSRLDVYTEKHCRTCRRPRRGRSASSTPSASGGINATSGPTRSSAAAGDDLRQHRQEEPGRSRWKYVEAFAGSDIETNPPATNDAVQASGRTITRQVDELPPPDVLDEIDAKVDMQHLEETLMGEGLAKFADPQKALLKLIAQKREQLAVKK